MYRIQEDFCKRLPLRSLIHVLLKGQDQLLAKMGMRSTEVSSEPFLIMAWLIMEVIRTYYQIFTQGSRWEVGTLYPDLSFWHPSPISPSDILLSSSSQRLLIPALLGKCFKWFLSNQGFPVFALWTICIRISNTLESQLSESHPDLPVQNLWDWEPRNLWFF